MNALPPGIARHLVRPRRLLLDASRSLWQWLRRDWPTKLGALALAVIVFLGLHTQSPKVETRFIRVPVEPDLLKESSKTISDISATEVKVELRGRVDQLQSIKPEELRLRVGRDLKNLASTVTIRLARNHIERTDGAYRAIPDDVRILSFEPDTIRLTIEEQCSRAFLIAMPEILGTPILGTVNTNAIDILGKREITVTGPSNIVAHLYDNSIRLATAPIDVSNSSQTFEETVDLVPPTAIRPYIEEPDMKVRVRVPINDETASASFSNILVNVAAVSSRDRFFTCSPTNVNVTVTGNKSIVSKVSPEDIMAIVFCPAPDGPSWDDATSLPVRVFFTRAELYSSLRLHDSEPLEVAVWMERVPPASPPAPNDPPPDVLFVPQGEAPAEGEPSAPARAGD